MSEVLVEKDAAVGTLTLNRPERLNAITGVMLDELSARLLELNRDPEVRVIVITGAGRGFCAGLDLKDAALVNDAIAQEPRDQRAALTCVELSGERIGCQQSTVTPLC